MHASGSRARSATAARSPAISAPSACSRATPIPTEPCVSKTGKTHKPAREPSRDAAPAAANAGDGGDLLRDPALYFNRELSQLDFNFRVLAQALDDAVPLLERLRF